MTDPFLAFLVKLPLALAVFLLIAYTGTVSKRIAGVLLTFPILNGIAVIAGADPILVADAIYPLVIFNCVLFALLISFPQSLPPLAALPRRARLLARVAIWGAAWLAGAYLITDLRQSFSASAALFGGATIFALAFMTFFWSENSPPNQSAARSAQEAGESADPARHWTRFKSFWGNATGLWRIALFGLAYAVLFWMSRAALDEKWVGMASALPLPGLFALAALIDDAEEKSAALHTIQSTLTPMRDTVFLGPVLVIPFNWVFSHLLVFALPPNAITLRYVLLFALWAVAALAVLLLVPKIAAHFDRRRS